MSYVDCFVAAVATAKRDEYVEFSKTTGALMREHGVISMVEYWGDDIPDGEQTSFPLAVKCAADETVVVSLMVWPSKAARDEGMPKVMSDPRMHAIEMPFDGKRAIMGGFEMLLEH